MKRILYILALLIAICSHAQDDCQYTTVTNENGIEIKSTPESLMYEKVFGGTSQFIFFSLTNNDGMPVLNFQLLAKSREFPKMYCIDKASKIYLQLMNGKIVTLISATEDQCSGLIYDSTEKNNIRVLTGTFLFTVGSLEDLEKSPVTFIRVKYVNETVDYITRKELQSEIITGKYFPETFFINNLKCIK